jgi:hypothetical protein
VLYGLCFAPLRETKTQHKTLRLCAFAPLRETKPNTNQNFAPLRLCVKQNPTQIKTLRLCNFA